MKKFRCIFSYIPCFTLCISGNEHEIAIYYTSDLFVVKALNVHFIYNFNFICFVDANF
jgi:hypothetical protein